MVRGYAFGRPLTFKPIAMDKDSIIELQKIDCNCNDCKYLIRSFELRQQHEDNHYRWQKDHFDLLRRNLLKQADKHILRGLRGEISLDEAQEKQKNLIKEAKELSFRFDKGGCTLSYGRCSVNGLADKQLKVVSFIPNTCQLHTQHCFKHRKDA